MPRYVILEHELPPGQPRGTHWDLMLERGEALVTWALSGPPSADAPVDGQELADHRRAYLDYEGPISGDRGSVKRWDEGHYETESETADRLQITLAGQRLRGSLTIERQTAAHFCRVSFSAAPTTG